MTKTEIVWDSLPPEQQQALLDSPMSPEEIRQKIEIERQCQEASQKAFEAELQIGQLISEIRNRNCWQKDDVFRTKSGGWKKSRSWNTFVIHNQLAESGKDADRLIKLWTDHQKHAAVCSQAGEG